MNELAVQSNQVSIYDRIQNPMEAIKQMGDFFAKSGMFGCEKVEQGMVIAMACMCERRNPIEISRMYHIIEGKLSMKSDAMLAGFRARGGKVKWIRADHEAAVAVFTIDGNETEISYTIEDAKMAGLYPGRPNSNWVKRPDAMLRARLVSKAVRMLTPEVNAGMYTPEEVEDFDRPSLPAIVTTTITDVPAPKTNEREVEKKRRFPAPEAPKPEVAVTLPEPLVDTKSDTRELPAVTTSNLNQLQSEVAKALGDKVDKAVQYLKSKSWILPDQGLNALSEEQCSRILARTGPFLRAIEQ